MQYLRRLVWYIASRLLVITLVLGLMVTGFYYAMNVTNINVVLKDGMARRASELAEDAGCSTSVIKTLCKNG